MRIFFEFPVDNHRITSKFNPNRKHPVTGKVQKHAGIDLVNTKVISAPIYATADGVVRLIKTTDGGYGKHIIITHDVDGTKYESLYAHLSSFNVKVGQNVKQGDKVATMGNTGIGTGVHLHFEIHEGTYTYDNGNYPTAIDPEKVLGIDLTKKEVRKDLELSQNGLEFIKKHEGHYLYWYELDDGGLTTGYGHYVPHTEAKKLGIKRGDKITQKQADDFLKEDMKKFVVGTNKQVEEYGFILNQNQFDALVSYAFNRGLGNSSGTNGLRQLLKNSSTNKELSYNFLVYWGTNTTYKKGLMNRRKYEKELFDTPMKNKTFYEKDVYELETSSSTMRKRLEDRYESPATHFMINEAAMKLLRDSESKLVNGQMKDGDFVANAAEVAIAAIKKLKKHNLY